MVETKCMMWKGLAIQAAIFWGLCPWIIVLWGHEYISDKYVAGSWSFQMFRSKNGQGTQETLSPDAAPQFESCRDNSQRARNRLSLEYCSTFLYRNCCPSARRFVRALNRVFTFLQAPVSTCIMKAGSPFISCCDQIQFHHWNRTTIQFHHASLLWSNPQTNITDGFLHSNSKHSELFLFAEYWETMINGDRRKHSMFWETFSGFSGTTTILKG